MRKKIYFLSILFALLWGLGSCSNETGIDKVVQKSSGNTVVFSIDGGTPITRATSAGNTVKTAALAREKAIESIYAVAFKNNVFYKTLKAAEDGGGYKFDMLQAGAFDVFLVANPDDALITQLETKVTSPTELAALVATQEPGADNTATNFLMTAEKFNVTTVAGTDTDAGVIKLTRAAARFDLYNRVEGLKMTKVTFKQRATDSRIATGTDMTGLTLTDTKTYEAAQGLTSNECIAAIYGYENTGVGSSVLTLEGTFNGKAIQSHDIEISGVAVQRNYLYSIIISSEGGDVTPGDPGKLKFEIVVNDWNEGTTLEWVGKDLVNEDAPSFTVSGTNITATPGVDNPTKIEVTEYTAADITVSVTSASSAGSKIELTVPTVGYSITPGAISNANGKLKQEFTIHLEENLGPKQSLKFSVINAFKSSANRNFTIERAGKNLKLPLAYVAEYNVNAAGDGFSTSHANDQSGYFNWFKASGTTNATHNPNGENIFNAPGLNGYHLPSEEEIRGIVTTWSIRGNVSYNGTSSTNNLSETISINGITKTYTADYKSKGNGICYGLRFKNTTLLSAWRYEYTNNPASPGEKMLKVTARYLGSKFSGSVDDIAKESYWDNNNGDDITRVFPAAGYKQQGVLNDYGIIGGYWAKYGTSYIAGCMYFYSSQAYTYRYSSAYHYSIRPFSDNE